MRKILMICPYFGKLPRSYFQLVLNSCRRNDTIDWLIITDDNTKYDYPDNVKVRYQSWEKFNSQVMVDTKKLLGYSVKLNKPYKLCDYKPLFGDIFKDDLKGYDFWGHTDISDVIYGNLRKYLTENILDSAEKINFLGHFVLYRNTPKINKRYLSLADKKNTLKKMLNSDRQYTLDEQGMRKLYSEKGYSQVVVNDFVADISPLRYAFQLSKYNPDFVQFYESYRPRIFAWRQGTLLSYYLDEDGNVLTEEFGYLHYQKRMMNNHLEDTMTSNYLITPDGFVPDQEVTAEIIEKYSPQKIYGQFFKLKWKALIARFKNLTEGNA